LWRWSTLQGVGILDRNRLKYWEELFFSSQLPAVLHLPDLRRTGATCNKVAQIQKIVPEKCFTFLKRTACSSGSIAVGMGLSG
jgi:hypothetical protein